MFDFTHVCIYVSMYVHTYEHVRASIHKNEEEDWSVLERSIDRLFHDRSLRTSQWDEEDAAPLYVEDSALTREGSISRHR